MVLIPIPYANEYTTTLKGQMPKIVQCEECQYDYVYLIEETVKGTATSVLFLDNAGAADRSVANARTQLDAALQHACGVVPCPSCGHVQVHMIPTARYKHQRWAWIVGVVAIVAGVVVSAAAGLYTLLDQAGRHLSSFTKTTWGVAGILLAIGVILVVWRHRRASVYLPNDVPVEFRIQTGRDLAVSLQEFLAIHGINPAPESTPSPTSSDQIQVKKRPLK